MVVENGRWIQAQKATYFTQSPDGEYRPRRPLKTKSRRWIQAQKATYFKQSSDVNTGPEGHFRQSPGGEYKRKMSLYLDIVQRNSICLLWDTKFCVEHCYYK